MLFCAQSYQCFASFGCDRLTYLRIHCRSSAKLSGIMHSTALFVYDAFCVGRYGYPKVMSSYQFDNRDQGPPTSGACLEAQLPRPPNIWYRNRNLCDQEKCTFILKMYIPTPLHSALSMQYGTLMRILLTCRRTWQYKRLNVYGAHAPISERGFSLFLCYE